LAWLTDMVIDTSGFRDAVVSLELKAPSAKPTQIDTISRIVMQRVVKGISAKFLRPALATNAWT
jgi:hypothetical protein